MNTRSTRSGPSFLLGGIRFAQPVDKGNRFVDVPLHRVRLNAFRRIPVDALLLTSPRPRLSERSRPHAVKSNGRTVEGPADLDEAHRRFPVESDWYRGSSNILWEFNDLSVGA